MINTIPAQSQGRQPRGLLFINGQQIEFERFEVSSTTFYQADTVHIDIPVKGQPEGYGLPYFSGVPAMIAEVYAGFPGNPEKYSKDELELLITAQIDDIEVNMERMSINLIGRSLTSQFIDNKTYEKFESMTPSQIAILIAKRRGLTPIVTNVTEKAGQIYKDNHAVPTEQSEWDLLTYLAQSIGFVVYVKERSLYFEPASSPNAAAYVLQWQSPNSENGFNTFNGMRLHLRRNMTLARDVIVKVHSYNDQYPKGFTKGIKATPNKRTVIPQKAQPIGDAQTYVQYFPGLTPAQALQKAQQLLKEISQQERLIRVTMPADNLLNKFSKITLKGTNSDWDQDYYPAEIVRVMSEHEGYMMEISAKNHSPNSMVAV